MQMGMIKIMEMHKKILVYILLIVVVIYTLSLAALGCLFYIFWGF